MLTASLWGTPPTRYYRFIRRVEEELHGKGISLCVLGCSDGKFVLPAARRGMRVLAIDVDEIALFGGMKEGPKGRVNMPGLVSRLKKEGLTRVVRVLQADFVRYRPKRPFDAVYSSGAIQYSRNLQHGIRRIMGSIERYVGAGGFLYIDYMLPLEPVHLGRDNFLSRSAMAGYFGGTRWATLHHRVDPPLLERAHVDNPVDHYHHWGHIFLRRAF